VVVGVHGTEPVLRIIQVFVIVAPGATQLPSGYVASLMKWASQKLQTADREAKLKNNQIKQLMTV